MRLSPIELCDLNFPPCQCCCLEGMMKDFNSSFRGIKEMHAYCMQ